jgi:hypothetical protein
MSIPLAVIRFYEFGNYVSNYSKLNCVWIYGSSYDTIYYIYPGGAPAWSTSRYFGSGTGYAEAVAAGSANGQYINLRMYLSNNVPYWFRTKFSGDVGWIGDLNVPNWTYRAGAFDNYVGIALWETSIYKAFNWTCDVITIDPYSPAGALYLNSLYPPNTVQMIAEQN